MAEIPNWRTSSYTLRNECVEIADNDPGEIMVRDTKDRSRGHISVRPATWVEFVEFSKNIQS